MKPTKLQPGEALAAAIACEITPQRLSLVLSEALVADQVNRDGSRSPDFRIRLAAVELVLARTVGLPARSEAVTTANPDADESEKLAERLARSPALRRSLARLLAAHADGDGDSPIDV
jgi:hypothetical protein